MKPATVRASRQRRLVHRRAGYFWRSPQDEKIYFVGASRAEADIEIERRLTTIAEAEERRRALDWRRPYRRALDNAISRAQRCGLEMMPVADFDAIVARAGGRCEVTGIPFDWEVPTGLRARIWAPSLDRINCSQGYLRDNCRLVCVAVNLALSDFGLDVLRKIAVAMVQRDMKAG